MDRDVCVPDEYERLGEVTLICEIVEMPCQFVRVYEDSLRVKRTSEILVFQD